MLSPVGLSRLSRKRDNSELARVEGFEPSLQGFGGPRATVTLHRYSRPLSESNARLGC